MTVIPYKPYSDRTYDSQYKDLLRFIRTDSETHWVKHPKQQYGRFTNPISPQMVFKFENGFPIITERNIPFWKTPITELLLFIRGVRTLAEMETAGLGWWGQWLSPEKCAIFGLEPGDMGPGSYGAILHDLPMPDGKTFNQVQNLVQSLKDGPFLNRHIISTWYPPFAMQHSQLQRQVVVAPCHGTKVQATVIDGKKLALKMNQCSCDVAVGGVANIIQWAAFTIMLGHVSGYEPYMYVHQVDDAQIYENQLTQVDHFLQRQGMPFPTLQLTEEGQRITNIFEFHADHFVLSDYHPQSAMNFPITN